MATSLTNISAVTIKKLRTANIIPAAVYLIYMVDINTDFSYKNFDLSILGTYSIGGKVYDSLYAGSMEVMYAGNTWNKHALRRWQQPGDITDVPRIQIGGSYTASDRFFS